MESHIAIEYTVQVTEIMGFLSHLMLEFYFTAFVLEKLQH